MKKWFQHSRLELLVYAGVWLIIFLAPIVSALAHEHLTGNVEFAWSMVLDSWKKIANFLFAFMLHDLFIAPLLVAKRKKWMYMFCALVFVLIVVYITDIHRPALPPPNPAQNVAMSGTKTPPPPLSVARHDLIYFTMLIIGVGFNTGVKGYFRWHDERERLEEIERRSLAQQIDYLRYQVNPHFLMNTLNNIHALVDIDSEKAKESIVKLSKMMRYLLYDGARKFITIQQVSEFINNYVSLMKMRYDERVKVTLDLPQSPPLRKIAPLIFVVFIENAFKHGVSYKQSSFINIRLTYEPETQNAVFYCCNSVIDSTEDKEQGGIGLENVLRRLDLIYGDTYKLDTNISDTQYCVTLTIPTIEEETQLTQQS